MTLTVCKKICNQCPFSKNSAPGWLGGEIDAQQTLDIMQHEAMFPCHKQRLEDVEETHDGVMSGKIPICRGFMVSARASCKMFGSGGEFGAALLKLQQSMEITKEEKDAVLKRWEFLEHHSV